MTQRSRLSVKLSAATIAAAVAVQVGDGGLSISERGVDLVMRWEDCRVAVYRDIAGNATAGCGHLITNGEYRVGQKLNEPQIRELIVEDLSPSVECVNKGVARAQTTQPQFDALVDFAFNVGCGAFTRSAVLSCHKKGDTACVVRVLGQYQYAGGQKSRGLANRRAAEIELYKARPDE